MGSCLEFVLFSGSGRFWKFKTSNQGSGKLKTWVEFRTLPQPFCPALSTALGDLSPFLGSKIYFLCLAWRPYIPLAGSCPTFRARPKELED